MTLYIFMAFLPLLLIPFFPNVNTDRKQKKYYCIIMGIALILFLALRHKALGSTDTINYYNGMKDAILSKTWNQYYDPDGAELGFQIFVWIISRFVKSPQWIIVFSSVIIVTSVLIFVWRNSKNIPLSVTMYICLGLMTFQMQGMRQALAMSICLFAYEFAKRRKIIPFALLVLLATQFHQTAIVFAVVYVFGYLKLKASHLLLVLSAAGVVTLLSDKIIDFANELFDRNYSNTVDSGGVIATAIYILIMVFCILASKQPYAEHIDATLFYVLLTGFVCFAMRYFGTLAAERISFYFMFSQIVLLPNTVCDGQIKSSDKGVVNMIVYLLSIALFAYRLAGSDFVPYRFFWG